MNSNKKLVLCFLFVMIAVLCAPLILLPHPGGVDKDGGHRNRKTGEYHYHNQSKSKQNDNLKYYPVHIDSSNQVYDGDTITGATILLKSFGETVIESEKLFPGIVIENNNLYLTSSIRIAGIDTPEKRPSKKGRTEESIAREKAAAKIATELLDYILKTYDYEFYISNPDSGKYANRVVADVYVGKEKISIADWMLAFGFAYEYNGGTKKDFDEWFD